MLRTEWGVWCPLISIKHARTSLWKRCTFVLRLYFEGELVLHLEHKELRLVDNAAHSFNEGAPSFLAGDDLLRDRQ